jgi:hypothetical protein
MNSLFNELCQPLTAYLSVVRGPLSVAQIVQTLQIVEIVQVVKIHRLPFLLFQILSPFPLVSPG